jgi:NAD(P)-dependent dehydrogenase (short-subunit alcohol dehydrogenase family)
MNGVLNGRAFVVTGTSRGIGTGIARRVLDGDASVLGVARSEPPEELGRHPRFRHLKADLATCSAEQVVGTALEHFGRVDGLVNNAGIQFFANCWEQDDTELDDMLRVNLTVPFLLSQAFCRHWVQASKPGVVVNICSIESSVGWSPPGQAGYAVTKGGLLGLTRAMALDLATHGIRVVAIGPGIIETEMSSTDAGYLDRIPLGNRQGTPDEIGDSAVFLLSDRASYVTGEILYTDGGYLLR